MASWATLIVYDIIKDISSFDIFMSPSKALTSVLKVTSYSRMFAGTIIKSTFHVAGRRNVGKCKKRMYHTSESAFF